MAEIHNINEMWKNYRLENTLFGIPIKKGSNKIATCVKINNFQGQWNLLHIYNQSKAIFI